MQYYTELVDVDKLDLLIENYDSLGIDWTKTTKKKDEQLAKLVAYRKKIVGGQIKVCYQPSSKQPDGRLYVEKGLGLQSIKRQIRQTITQHYNDYDMKAALPNILAWYSKKNGMECPNLEKVINDYTFYKKHKNDMYLCMFGGCSDFKELQNEIKNIQTFMVGQFPNRKGVKKSNYLGSLCACILQEYESKILNHAEDFLLKNGISVVNMIKIFDGFELPSNLVVDLDKLNAYILEQTGIPVTFVNKPKDEIIDVSKFESLASKWEKEYREMKEDFEKHVAMIRNPLCYVVKSSKAFMRVNKNDLQQLYAHLTLGKKRHAFVTEWLKDSNKRIYENIDFIPPPLECPNDTFNVWTGFEILDTKLFDYSHSDLDPFFSLIDLMVNFDPKGSEYLVKWIADMIQNPGRKNGVAIVIRGNQGIGKNTLESMVKKIIGEKLHCSTSNPKEDIFGAYNNLSTNKIPIFVNETESKDTFANNARLKDLITEPTENVREKYVKNITMRSFCRLIFLSNSRIVVKVEQNDRRFVIFEASDKMRNNREYFSMINEWMNNPFNIRKLFDYLSRIDISDFNFVNERPITEAYLETKDACKCVELKFLDDLLHDCFKPEIKMTHKAIADKIKSDYNLPRDYDMRTFTAFLKRENVPGIQKLSSTNTRGYTINRSELLEWMVENAHHKPETYAFTETETEYETDF